MGKGCLAIFQITRLEILLTFKVLLLTSCVIGPAPYLSDHWTERSAKTLAPVENENARLQVFITYSGLASSHTALRLVDSNEQVIFWDPAGDYGRFDDDWHAQYGPLPQKTERKHDLIVINPPDIPRFIHWRWTVHDTRVEVFEWDLTPPHASLLRNTLLNGADTERHDNSFSTWTTPMFCTIATSEFLRRFASPVIQLQERYFFPDNLARALSSQSPTHVLVFTPDGQKTVYTPPGPTSVRQ